LIVMLLQDIRRLGLTRIGGTVRLTGPETVPKVQLAPDLAHPLAAEQLEGVYPERVLEWLAPALHAR